MPDPQPTPAPLAQPGDPLDLEQSVAGEEDPGASIEVVNTPTQPVRPVPPAPGRPEQ